MQSGFNDPDDLAISARRLTDIQAEGRFGFQACR
jgi:hypothetical protein